jgi:hypothetical protein
MARQVMRPGTHGSEPAAGVLLLQNGGRREPGPNAGMGASRRSRVRTGAIAVAAAVGALGVPAAASAAISSPPQAPHLITVFPVRDFVSADGFLPDDRPTIEVFRDGQLIGRAAGIVPQDPDRTDNVFEGLVEVNHPGGGCWGDGDGSPKVTPDILPGDVVRITTAPDTGDETTTQNVTAGAVLNPSAGTIVVHGTAQDAGGNPLPIADIEARLVGSSKDRFDAGGKRDLRAPGQGTIAYDTPGSTHWTATFGNLTDTDVTRALAAQSTVSWLGRTPQEGTIYEYGEVGGPTAPCTAPLAQNAVLSSTPSSVNGAFAISNGTLRLSGVAQPGTTAVTATLTDSKGRAVDSTAVALTGTSWTATFPAFEVTGLADGTMTASMTYTLDTGATLAGTPLRIDKDTVGPAAAPKATPAAGLFNADQSVGLTTEPGADIFFTTDGSEPTAASTAYAGAINVTASRTIRAIAIDRAGNAGPVGAYDYTIDKVAPKTSDDVGTAPVRAGTPVILSRSDGTGSGVAETWYTLNGSDPSNDANPARRLYDPASGPVLADGQKITYYSIDQAGNEEVPHSSVAANVDTTAPTTTDDLPATGWARGPVAVTLTATDNTGGAGVEAIYYTTNGSDPRTSASRGRYDPLSKPTLANGQSLRYSAVDVFGNVEVPHATATARVDTTGPVTNDDVSPTAISATDVAVTLAAADTGGSGVASTWYTLNGSDPADAANASRRQYTGTPKPTLANGQAITYASVDNVGNWGAVKTSAAAHVDKAAPTTTDDVPTAWGATDVTVTLTAGDGTGGAGVQTTWYTTDGSDPTLASNGARKAYNAAARPVLTPGQTIRYSSVDNVGNVEPIRSAAAKIDRTAPVTTDNVPAAPQPTAQTVTLTASDAGSGVAATWYTLDGSDPTAASNTARRRYDAAGKPVLSNGQTITYASVDALGNAEVRHASAVVTVQVPAAPAAAPAVATGSAPAAGSAAPAPAPAPVKAAPAPDAAGASAVPAPAPAAPPAALAASSIKARSLSASSAKKHGVTMTVTLPAGTTAVSVELSKLSGAQAARTAAAARTLASRVFLTNGKAGPFRIRMNSARLRRQLKPGVYRLRVRIGTSAAKLGAPATVTFRIRR